MAESWTPLITCDGEHLLPCTDALSTLEDSGNSVSLVVFGDLLVGGHQQHLLVYPRLLASAGTVHVTLLPRGTPATRLVQQRLLTVALTQASVLLVHCSESLDSEVSRAQLRLVADALGTLHDDGSPLAVLPLIIAVPEFEAGDSGCILESSPVMMEREVLRELQTRADVHLADVAKNAVLDPLTLFVSAGEEGGAVSSPSSLREVLKRILQSAVIVSQFESYLSG